MTKCERREQPIADSGSTSYRELSDAGPGAERLQPLAAECAIAISYNGINYAVMLATPHFLQDFARGFSLTAGIVSDLSQILDIQIQPYAPGHSDEVRGVEHTDFEKGIVENKPALLLDITLNQRATHGLKQRRRSLTGTTGCGLCGVDAIEKVLPSSPLQASGSEWPALPALEHLIDLRRHFADAQQSLHSSGAMHGAMYMDARGQPLYCREDIGRHNALDKVIGACLYSGMDTGRGYFATTSRCSLELVQKVAFAGGSTLVTLSSPSELSVYWARRNCLNLIHLPLHSLPRVYSPGPVKPVESAGPE